jgi:hypothetical protein
MNRTMFTGKIGEEEMRRHHPLEYEELMAARAVRPGVPAGIPAVGQVAADPPTVVPSP